MAHPRNMAPPAPYRHPVQSGHRYEDELLDELSSANMLEDIIQCSSETGVFGTGRHIRVKFRYHPNVRRLCIGIADGLSIARVWARRYSK